MKLIADSGSTNTTWCLLDDRGGRREIHTNGLNPYQHTGEELAYEIATALVPMLPDTSVSEVYFYGAGCIYDKVDLMRRIISSQLRVKKRLEVCSDILAAARGLYQARPGIACILGTGSNSCLYDGKKIVQNVSSLGYVLGDEGSGSVIGRNFVSDLLKNQLGNELKEKFLNEYKTDVGEIIDNVYRRPSPNRYLASFSPFILKNIGNEQVHALVKKCFKAFFERNVMQYDHRNYPIGFVGSVAYYYKDVLCEAAAELGLAMGDVAQTPMEGLIKYHSIR